MIDRTSKTSSAGFYRRLMSGHGGFILRRTGGAIITALIAVSAVFWIIHIVPGDPAVAILSAGGDQSPSPQAVERLRAELGLDKPLLQQFATFLSNVLHGDLGRSFVTRRPVTQELMVRIPRTLQLAVPAMVLALVGGVLLGLISAAREGEWIDTTLTAVMSALFAVPVFVYAIAFGYIFSIQLGWLPVGRYVSPGTDFGNFLLRALLPILSLSLMPMAVVARTARTAVIEQRSQEYVKLAYSKGLSRRKVLLTHVAPNAMVPVTAVTGLQFGQLLASSVLVEFAFNWPGLNLFMIQSIGQRDYPAVIGVVVVISLAFVFVNLITDLLYGWLDPRVRNRSEG